MSNYKRGKKYKPFWRWKVKSYRHEYDAESGYFTVWLEDEPPIRTHVDQEDSYCYAKLIKEFAETEQRFYKNGFKKDIKLGNKLLFSWTKPIVNNAMFWTTLEAHCQQWFIEEFEKCKNKKMDINKIASFFGSFFGAFSKEYAV